MEHSPAQVWLLRYPTEERNATNGRGSSVDG